MRDKSFATFFFLLLLVLSGIWVYRFTSEHDEVAQADIASLHSHDLYASNKCQAIFHFHNQSKWKIKVDLSESQVSIVSGKWRSLFFDVGGDALCSTQEVTIPAGEKVEIESCELKLNCSVSRKFRFQMHTDDDRAEDQALEFVQETDFQSGHDFIVPISLPN
ncbi:MAG: hypothetical protein AAFY71_15295 [Bacteroidota bacterium]